MKTTTKHILWTNEIDYDDWKEDLEAVYPDEEGYDEEDRIRIMYEDNNSYLEDEKANLNKELNMELVMIGHLGLWDGTRHGWKRIKGTNLNDIFSETCGDYVTWYVDGKTGDVCCTDKHHDGTNHYIYRAIKPELSDWDFDEAMAIGTDIDELTIKLGNYVADIYGFKKEWEEE